ncbi:MULTISPECIES: hypothetical protein [unclassified Nocardioides]|uniref:hypothetical protein n=1 Tax=unclassified Nocardioides TaxID=2615069 RepID=UPI0030157BF8
MRRAAVLLSALALLATPVVTAGSAAAETWTHRDARGDVVDVPYDDDLTKITANPDDVAADITRLSVRHGTRRVTVTLGLRDLRTGGTGVGVRLVTPRGDFTLTAFAVDGLRMHFFQETAKSDSDEEVACRGDRVRLQPRHDRVRVSIPRTCLGEPRWVRAGGIFMHGIERAVAEEGPFQVDEALHTGMTREFVEGDAYPVARRKVRVS